jgi:AcrR family transcriptional regulator
VARATDNAIGAVALAMSSARDGGTGGRRGRRPGSGGATQAHAPGGAGRRPTAVVARSRRVGAAHVSEVQRARILAAAMQVVGEHGYAGMSVSRVTTRAGVSRRTFYDLFEDREDCFVAVFHHALARADAVAVAAAQELVGWREQVRVGLSALLLFLGDEPVLGKLLIQDALGAGPNVLARRAQGLVPIYAFLEQGRSQTKGSKSSPPMTAEGVVGAVLAVLHARMLEHERDSLLDLLNPLMGMIVLPYLGPAAAAKELSRSTPHAGRAPRRAAKDPLQGLGMRLTYRTLRVLAAIAERPGASNREVAAGADVHDQGQISKLLARLEHLGLIANAGQGHAKGEANAWRLTSKGERLERTVRVE